MKKTISLTLLAILLCVASFAQSKKSTTAEGPVKLELRTITNKGVITSNYDTVILAGKTKVLMIDSVNISMDVLNDFAKQMKANKLPLYVTLDWVAGNWQFIKKATNPGLNDEQMDILKQPLIPWVQYIQKLQEQQIKN